MALADAWRDDPLSFLIGTDAARTFLSDSYEKQAVIASAPACGLAAERFAAVLSIAEVDRIVTGTDLRTGDLLLADASLADGIESSAYIDDQGYVDRGAVAMRYRQGATVILNQAQRLIPALGRLCQGIEHVFSCHVQTNLYLTPPGSQGFPTHFDNHDVFVIQSEGEKLWRLYDMPVDIPYRGEHFSRHVHATGALRDEFVLKAGDVAYVPRGMMHDAATSGDAPSLHITVGLITRTWADLLLEAVSEVALRQPLFRRSLPAGYARAGFDRTEARATLAELGRLLSSDLRLDPAMDLLADTFVRGRAAINSGAISHAAQPIGPTDRFCLEPLAPWRRSDEAGDGGRACLTVPGSDLWFTAESKAALTRALDATPFLLSDLAFDHAEALVRRLLAYGLVRRC
jgi:hypothetical protein